LLDSPNRKNKNEGYENEYDQENLLMIFPRVFCNKLLVTVRLINFEIPNRRRKNRTMAITVSRILISTKSIVFFIKNRKVFYRKTTRIKEFSKPLYFQTPALETLKTG